jgi:hypothetical protein
VLLFGGLTTVSGAGSREAAPAEELQRDIDRDSLTGIPVVVQVVAVVDVVYVDVVIVIPVVAPGLRPWVNRADPITVVLKARIAADHQEGKSVDSEAMAGPEVSAEAVIRDAIAAITATLLPGAVIGLPIL